MVSLVPLFPFFFLTGFEIYYLILFYTDYCLLLGWVNLLQGIEWHFNTLQLAETHCIAIKSSVPQGMIVCFDKEVGWCVGIAVILRVVGRER
jgi:hypothetical protein